MYWLLLLVFTCVLVIYSVYATKYYTNEEDEIRKKKKRTKPYSKHKRKNAGQNSNNNNNNDNDKKDEKVLVPPIYNSKDRQKAYTELRKTRSYSDMSEKIVKEDLKYRSHLKTSDGKTAKDALRAAENARPYDIQKLVLKRTVENNDVYPNEKAYADLGFWEPEHYKLFNNSEISDSRSLIQQGSTDTNNISWNQKEILDKLMPTPKNSNSNLHEQYNIYKKSIWWF